VSLLRGLRALSSLARGIERVERRRYNEAVRELKALRQQQVAEWAKATVEKYEAHIDQLRSVHVDAFEPVDWQALANAPTEVTPQPRPREPVFNKSIMTDSERRLRDYRPGCFSFMFGSLARAERAALERAVDEDRQTAEAAYASAHEVWRANCEKLDADEAAERQRKQEIHEGASRVMAGPCPEWLEAFDELYEVSELAEFGTHIQLSLREDGAVEAIVDVLSNDIVPASVLTLTKTGKLSERDMPKTARAELYHDFVCGAALRTARDIFAIIPTQTVYIAAVDDWTDPATGHTSRVPLVSFRLERRTAEKINFRAVDPSDCVSRLPHEMQMKRGLGPQPCAYIDGMVLRPTAPSA
jgi:hypothetical protein